MRTTLVCGMLGAGKTSFLQNTLRQTREKVAVLVNDFGDAGIDGEILSVEGLDVIEIPSGCVCCTLRFDLIRTVEKVRNTWRPDHLLIEPSGVASPSGVLEALASLKLTPVTVVGIVDAEEFIDFYESDMFGTFLTDQIVNADVVLVNKTDLVNRPRIQATIDLVTGLNQGAIVMETVHAVVDEPLPGMTQRRTPTPPFAGGLPCDAISLSLSGEIRFESAHEFFRDLAAGRHGRVLRAKALVRTDRGPYRFDLASGRVSALFFDFSTIESRFVVLGKAVNETSIRDWGHAAGGEWREKSS